MSKMAESVEWPSSVNARYLVVRDGNSTNYGVRTLFEGETWSVVVDDFDGSKVTIIRDSRGNTIDSAGEAVEEFESFVDARVCAGRMIDILEVMER